MADNKLLQQMLEHLVNDEQQKAEELFHEYVVTKSREIYESMIDSEIAEEDEKKDDEEDKKVDEASDDEDNEDKKKVDEEFEDITVEDDIEEGPDMMGGDGSDELEKEIDAEMDDDEEEEEKDEEELFQDLEAIVDELQAKFDELKGEEAPEMGDKEGNPFAKEDTDLETVREYVEKVATPKGGDNGANTKSVVDNMKNDMGGTVENIVRGGEEKGGDHAGLSEIKPKEDNAGNINVPGGKAGNAFSKKEPGHGAEKKGAAEQADNKQSLFRGRR